MLADKSALDEQHPAYIGMYDGRLMKEAVREFVESCDIVLRIGTVLSDFNTGAFTSHIGPEKTVDIQYHVTLVGAKFYPNIEKDVLTELTRRVPKLELSPDCIPVCFGGGYLPEIVAETLRAHGSRD